MARSGPEIPNSSRRSAELSRVLSEMQLETDIEELSAQLELLRNTSIRRTVSVESFESLGESEHACVSGQQTPIVSPVHSVFGSPLVRHSTPQTHNFTPQAERIQVEMNFVGPEDNNASFVHSIGSEFLKNVLETHTILTGTVF